MAEKKVDKTRNKRQARRRIREKNWLFENGWSSWESLHTALLSGLARITTTKNEENDNSN